MFSHISRFTNSSVSGKMAEVDPTMGDKAETKSRLDDIKYYTSLFLGALAINCVFGFLFLVPFVLDPAISTLMHDFIEDPVHCKVTKPMQPDACKLTFVLR
jgi:hypothetical protein